MEIAASCDESVNDDSFGLTHILTKFEVWMEMDKVTTIELQITLKVALHKFSNQDIKSRLRTVDFNKDNIIKFGRNQWKMLS